MFWGRKLALKERIIKETVDLEEVKERANEKRIVEGYNKQRKEERKAKIKNIVSSVKQFKAKKQGGTSKKAERKEKGTGRMRGAKRIVEANKLQKPKEIYQTTGGIKW